MVVHVPAFPAACWQELSYGIEAYLPKRSAEFMQRDPADVDDTVFSVLAVCFWSPGHQVIFEGEFRNLRGAPVRYRVCVVGIS